MERNEIDWNEPPLVRWMGTTTRKGTAKVYRCAIRAYVQFTGLTPTQLIDEAIEDQKRDARERTEIVKKRILEFYQWLQKEYTVVTRGGEKNVKGVRPKTAECFVGGVRSFYSTYDVAIKLKGRQRLPKARVHNKRMQLSTLDVKALIDHARNPRDRAIILAMFQGGMDVSTLCGILYGDVVSGLAKNEQPLKLELHREKTGVEHYTFLGKDSVNAIRAYLNDAKSRGIPFKANTPLFVQEVKGARGEALPLTPNIVQKVMRELGVRSGLVDDENNGKDMNPVSPHALRESFGSIMINSGVPDTVVDFWLGHEIGEMSEAYKGGRLNELRALYAEKEKLVSVGSNGSQAIEDVRAALSKEIATLAEKVATLEEKLKWAIDEITELEKEATEEEQ